MVGVVDVVVDVVKGGVVDLIFVVCVVDACDDRKAACRLRDRPPKRYLPRKPF